MSLKPCPFCGASPEMTKYMPDEQYSLVCPDCGTDADIYAPIDEAVKQWNRRPIEDALVEALKMQGREYYDGTLCFCGMSIGNPMFPKHSAACEAARAALAKVDGKVE